MERVTVSGLCCILKSLAVCCRQASPSIWVQHECEPPSQTLVELGESLKRLETVQDDLAETEAQSPLIQELIPEHMRSQCNQKSNRKSFLYSLCMLTACSINILQAFKRCYSSSQKSPLHHYLMLFTECKLKCLSYFALVMVVIVQGCAEGNYSFAPW